MGLQYTMMTNTWVLQKVHGQTTKSSFCCKKMEIQECSSLYKVYGKYVSWKICNDFKMKFIFLLRISFVLHNFFFWLFTLHVEILANTSSWVSQFWCIPVWDSQYPFTELNWNSYWITGTNCRFRRRATRHVIWPVPPLLHNSASL